MIGCYSIINHIENGISMSLEVLMDMLSRNIVLLSKTLFAGNLSRSQFHDILVGNWFLCYMKRSVLSNLIIIEFNSLHCGMKHVKILLCIV